MFFDKLINMFKIDQTDSNKNAYTYRNQSYLSNFSLSDIQQYNGMPFYIDHSLLMYVTHVYIPFSKQNESICLEHIKQLNALIFPLKKYTQNTFIPETFWCKENPNPFLDDYPSQIRFEPFTPSGRQSKYPVSAFISNMTELYGNYGIQQIFYKCNGKIGKADLSYSQNEKAGFRIQIREKAGALYVRRIDKVYKVRESNSPVPYLKTEIQYILD